MKNIIKIFSIITLCLGLYSCNWDGPRVDVTEVTTNKPKNITSSSVRLSADCNMNSQNIDKCGFCYSVVPMPTKSDEVVSMNVNEDDYDYSNDYSFDTVLKNLLPGTTYYVRAFIQNEYSIAYGNEVAFQTKGSLNVTTIKVEEGPGSMLSVTVKADSKDGISTCDLGYIISTDSSLTFETCTGSTLAINHKTSLETTMGEGVKPGVTYYVRGVAKVGEVYSYGDVLSITMQPSKE